MAAKMSGSHVPLAEPYGAEDDLPFTRPLVIAGKLDGSTSILLRLDSGSNVPLLYGPSGRIRTSAPRNLQLLSRLVDGATQNFVVLPPQDLILPGGRIRQVSFVEPMNSIGGAAHTREDGLLPTQLFQRVLVSYRNHFAIL